MLDGFIHRICIDLSYAIWPYKMKRDIDLCAHAAEAVTGFSPWMIKYCSFLACSIKHHPIIPLYV